MDFVQSFRLTAPEVLFSLSGLVLLLAAAWSRSDAGARIITWLAVAVLAVAAALTAPALKVLVSIETSCTASGFKLRFNVP